MLAKIQKFGAAMFTPVLLFAFSGIVVGITIVFTNPSFVGSLADSDSACFKMMHIIQEGGWTVFRNMPLLFVLGLPIGLAKNSTGRAVLASAISYLTWNYFINAIGMTWGDFFNVDFSQEIGSISGLTMIAGVKTLDTNILGAIFIAGISTYIHNKFFNTQLPSYIGIFQGTSFVVIILFFIVLALAFLTLYIWPQIQHGIISLQGIMVKSGTIGVWLYTFLERFLIPTGLHHFIYGPFVFGPAVVEGGVQAAWIQHIQEFSQSTKSLKELFPQGGFALHGNSKIFGCLGIAGAMYFTSLKENKKKVLGLLIPATLTAMLVGITEPLEFTFLFLSPILWLIHSILAATMSAMMFKFGIVGNMGGGLIEIVSQNWLPMFKNHASNMFIQWIIGFIFSIIWFVIFRFFILKFDLKTPGRDLKANIKLYSKQDSVSTTNNKINKHKDALYIKAEMFLLGLGGEENIKTVTNCATRLRVEVLDKEKVLEDNFFIEHKAHGVYRKGNSIQVIVGLEVPQVKDKFVEIMKNNQ